MIIDLMMRKDLVGVLHHQNQLQMMVVDGAPLVVGVVIMNQKMVVGVRM